MTGAVCAPARAGAGAVCASVRAGAGAGAEAAAGPAGGSADDDDVAGLACESAVAGDAAVSGFCRPGPGGVDVVEGASARGAVVGAETGPPGEAPARPSAASPRFGGGADATDESAAGAVSGRSEASPEAPAP